MKGAAIIGGLAGAGALTLLNESVRRVDKKAPRLELVGMEALKKGMKKVRVTPPGSNALYGIALAGDVISNALYYSLASAGTKRSSPLRGALMGLSMGLGAIALPKRMGLSDAPVTRSTRTKVMTVAWYVLGGVAASLVINLLNKKR